MADSNYYDRFADNQNPTEPQQTRKEKVSADGAAFSLTKVFGYMFAGLLITTVIALGLGAFFNYILLKDTALTDFETTAGLVMIGLLIVSAIGILVLSFVVPITVARGKHSVLVPSIIYTVLMGIMLSTIAAFIPWYLLGITFGITCAIFGVMTLIAFLSKGHMPGLAIAAIGLFIGAGIIALFMWILMLMGQNVTVLYWIVSLATFAAMMLITIFDLARIKTIAKNGEMTNNLSLYCAFILYNDFIYILLRVLRFVLIIFASKK